MRIDSFWTREGAEREARLRCRLYRHTYYVCEVLSGRFQKWTVLTSKRYERAVAVAPAVSVVSPTDHGGAILSTRGGAR